MSSLVSGEVDHPTGPTVSRAPSSISTSSSHQVNAEGVAQERVDVVPTTVDVVGTTVSFAVPIDQLPPIDGTPTWQFGTSASGGAVFDDCNELVQ